MTARKLSAFLVEDSPLLRSQVTELLEELAPVIVVDVAEDETEALDWLVRDGNHCDVAVVDIFLKRGNGLMVLQKAVKLRPDVHFVVLSNAATAEVRRWCDQLGARAVFDKSTEIDDLVRYCSEFAGKSLAVRSGQGRGR
ncbi:response regulator [Rhizobacter sp. Root404]|uniref:response regulator n=1 Tax=Rhizobacter sp. Root404 TaxID=1736528 RepID=UPI0009EA5354|nr:response regulator [Rhizobacter sp. Root404]